MPEFKIDDETEFECPATPTGIAQCLRMLADEAAVLNLSHTLAAINEALETCERESSTPAAEVFPPDVTLH